MYILLERLLEMLFTQVKMEAVCQKKQSSTHFEKKVNLILHLEAF